MCCVVEGEHAAAGVTGVVLGGQGASVPPGRPWEAEPEGGACILGRGA